jgi:hypothetical protein
VNCDIVDAMSTVNELIPSPAGTVAAAGAADDVAAGADDDDVAAGVEDDEHAAAIRAATPTTATPPNRERSLFLLPSSIYTPFAAMYADTPTRDTAEHACPYVLDGRCCGD